MDDDGTVTENDVVVANYVGTAGQNCDGFDDTGGSDLWNCVTVFDGDNIGAVAQDAVVAILVAEMLDPASGLTVEDLEAFVLGDATTLPVFDIGDPFDPDTGNTALVNILEASGLGDALGLGGTI